jgi:hypothetical protein
MPHRPQQLGIDSRQPCQCPRIVSIVFSIALGDQLHLSLGEIQAAGQPPKTPGMKSSGIYDLGYRAFRRSNRFTATECVPKARASSLAQRDYR